MLTRWRRRGFVGPRYEGILGKLRFAYQHFVVRTDVVLVACPEDPQPIVAEPRQLVLERVGSWERAQALAPLLDEEYWPGYVEAWKPCFSWGETLVLARLDGRVAGFGWLQTGSAAGTRCEYAVLGEHEFRVLRVGVVPSARGRGVNTRFYRLLLDELFAQGAKRVYVDCTIDNEPSLKAQTRAGFRIVGKVRVRGVLLGRQSSSIQPILR